MVCFWNECLLSELAYTLDIEENIDLKYVQTIFSFSFQVMVELTKNTGNKFMLSWILYLVSLSALYYGY